MVLAGGGAKGAYEVGCWLEMQKMTKELGFKIDAFSGTSVGALNSALFACNSPEEIDKIWSKVTKEKIFSDKFNKILNVINDCFDDIDETKVLYLLIPLIAKITHGFDPKGLSQIIDDAKDHLSGKENIIDHGINCNSHGKISFLPLFNKLVKSG